MSDKAPLYAIPIAQRPARSPRVILRGIAYVIFLLTSMILINGTQFLVLPLAILPPTRGLYTAMIGRTKAAFGILLVLSSQLFGQTSFRITYDTSNAEPGQSWVEMNPGDATSTGVSLNWPKKVVMIANHQIYADWVYLWALSYFANMHAHVLIVLKKSLKWVPVGGWGMQFFRFIFLARSWAADKDVLTSNLSTLAAHHTTTTSERPEDDEPLNFMIFVESTLFSAETLPVSKKYADKMGYLHPSNTLLPRSTGLHTSLLALSQVPSLYLMDVTMAYPGVPRAGYGQSYYTLRSIFMDGIPPPEVICHVRLFNIQKDVPLRANRAQQQDTGLTLEQRKEAAKATAKNPGSLEASDEDKKVFDSWLRERWMEKDAMLEAWHEKGGKGPLVTGPHVEEVVFPIQMKGALGFL